MKSGFQSSQGLVQLKRGLCRSVKILLGFKAELMFDLGRLQKVLNTLSIIELEIKLVQFH